MNPWSLTDRECDCLQAVGRCGDSKIAARELGISHRTVEKYLERARQRMNVARTLIAVLKWDRYVNARTDKAVEVE